MVILSPLSISRANLLRFNTLTFAQIRGNFFQDVKINFQKVLCVVMFFLMSSISNLRSWIWS